MSGEFATESERVEAYLLFCLPHIYISVIFSPPIILLCNLCYEFQFYFFIY